MKTLIVCYSLTGKTKQLCTAMKRSLGATVSFVSEARSRTLIGAYIFGSLKARTRKASLIKPLDADITEYDQIIVAGPVWWGFPAPALNDFVRQYDLDGKRVYGFLTYAGNAGQAEQALREEILAANARFKNILTLQSNRDTVHAIKGGRMRFDFDEEGLLCLVKGISPPAP